MTTIETRTWASITYIFSLCLLTCFWRRASTIYTKPAGRPPLARASFRAADLRLWAIYAHKCMRRQNVRGLALGQSHTGAQQRRIKLPEFDVNYTIYARSRIRYFVWNLEEFAARAREHKLKSRARFKIASHALALYGVCVMYAPRICNATTSKIQWKRVRQLEGAPSSPHLMGFEMNICSYYT